MAYERLVVALGGNALLRQGDRGSAAEQEARSVAAMDALAPLLTPERQVVITHGNGPIVGNILIRHRLARHAVPPMPLDVCGAESQGNIGYLLERALRQVLRQIKATFLPVFEQVVEKIFALNKDAATFNRTVSIAHLPQTQFLQCRVDSMQLLAALADLDVIVTPEMEQLAAPVQAERTLAENSGHRPEAPGFLATERYGQ